MLNMMNGRSHELAKNNRKTSEIHFNSERRKRVKQAATKKKQPTVKKQAWEGDLLVRFIPLEDLLPNPYQPATRLAVAPEVAKAFALSIQEHGLIQTPVVRDGRNGDGKYEIADGWLRRAGFDFLVKQIGLEQYAKMPCVIRELTDQQMADMVLEANTIRKDLNPIELARLYKRYLEDFKIPQVELARRHNCSQGEIANTIRLLELPADIQEKVISQEISETHGRQLLRLNPTPEKQQVFLKRTLERSYSVNELAETISNDMYYSSKNVDPREHPEPTFDLTECESCAQHQKIGAPYNSKRKTWRCLNPECWEKKQEQGLKEQTAKLAAEIQAAKDAARAQNQGSQGKKKGKNQEAVIDCTKLPYHQYAELDSFRKIDNPGQCKACPNRAVGKMYSGRTEVVCIDPKCYKAKEKAYDAKKAAEEREAERKLGERIKAACERNGADGTVLQLLAQHFTQHSRKDTREKVARLFGSKDPNACFAVEDEAELTQRLAAMVVVKEHLEGDKGLFLRMLAALEGKSADLEKQIEAFRKKFCDTCENKDGEYPCSMMMRQWPDGECWRYRPVKNKKKDKGVDENASTDTEKSSSDKTEDQELQDSLPCKTCANAETCDRSFFIADEDGGYSCDKKRELEEITA